MELPHVYTFAPQWSSAGEGAEREEIERLFALIPPSLELSAFLRVGQSNWQKRSETDSQFVFRGFISFYGRHYVAYFYSEREDSWVRFDDSSVSKVGNFQKVIEKCVQGRQQPVLLFFERESFLKATVAKPYYKDDTINATNFWKGKEARPFKV